MDVSNEGDARFVLKRLDGQWKEKRQKQIDAGLELTESKHVGQESTSLCLQR